MSKKVKIKWNRNNTEQTAGQKEVARKGKALGRGNQKRQRQQQLQQRITTMINCSYSVAPQATQTLPKSPVYQNPS